MQEVFFQAELAVLFLVGVGGLGDAIAVEHDAGAGGELDFGLGIVAWAQSQRQSYFCLQEACLLPFYEERLEMTCAGEGQGACFGIEDGEDHGDKARGREILDEQSIELRKHFAGGAAGFGERTQNASAGCHQKSSGGALAGYIGQRESPAAFFHWDEVIPVAADRSGGDAEAGDGEPGDEWGASGQESLLDGACFEGVTGHLFALVAYLLEEARVLQRDGDVAAQGLEDLQLLRPKSIQLGMGRGEDADELVLDVQGDGDLGEGGLLAGHVVGVLADVGCVAHLAGGGDVADQSFLAQFQAMPFVVQGAAVDAGQHEFLALGLVEIDVGFYESEGAGYLIHDAIDELIEIEKGTDAVGGLLQAEQIVHQICRLRQREVCRLGQSGDLVGQDRDGSHEAPPQIQLQC